MWQILGTRSGVPRREDLGTPVGSSEFIHALAMERLDEERLLWEGHPLGAGLAVCVENYGAIRRAPVSAQCHLVCRVRALKVTTQA